MYSSVNIVAYAIAINLMCATVSGLINMQPMQVNGGTLLIIKFYVHLPTKYALSKMYSKYLKVLKAPIYPRMLSGGLGKSSIVSNENFINYTLSSKLYLVLDTSIFCNLFIPRIFCVFIYLDECISL